MVVTIRAGPAMLLFMGLVTQEFATVTSTAKQINTKFNIENDICPIIFK